MTVAGMVKSSFVDYPGLISCVLFVPCCNYNCFYCHNRALLDGTYEKVDPESIKKFLNSRKGILDAVVITGGEPTLQPDLIPFLKEIKRMGFRLKLDTNGSSPDTVSRVLREELCDYYAVDYKAPASAYPEIAGKNANGWAVLETIRLLMKSGADFEVRTTVFPQLNEDDLILMARELPPVPRYVLNRYRKPEKYLGCDEERVNQPPYPQSRIEAFADLIRRYQPNITT